MTDLTAEEGTVNVDFEAQQTQDVSTQTDFSARKADLLDAVTECNKKIEILKSKIKDLKQQQHDTQRKYDSLRRKLFSLDSFKAKNSGTAVFYTGFQDWDSFTAIYNYLDPGEQGENINYWLSGNTDINVVNYDDDDSDEMSLNKKGRARSLKPVEEFFMVLCRLRQGFHEDHLSYLFNISVSTVSRIFITWINYMYLKLGTINIWLSRKIIDLTMPEVSKSKHKTTFTLLRIGLKTAEKSNKTAFRLHSTGADLFENVSFAVATRPRFLNVVERKQSATWRYISTNVVNFWCRL